MKKILTLALFVGLLFSLVNCGDPVEPEKTVLNVTPSEVSIQVGSTKKVVAVITPEERGPAVWQTENEKVATISADGVISGVAVGETKVFAVAKDGSKAFVLVRVTKGEPLDIKIDSAVTQVNEGERIQIKVTNLPEGTKATFAIRDGKIASVDQDGWITGVLEGRTLLTIEVLEKRYDIIITVASKDIIQFVDADFKKKVLSLLSPITEEPIIDTNMDGEISKKEALAVTGQDNPLILGVGPEGGVPFPIKSLEDLKWFPNVTSLWLAGLQTVTTINTAHIPKCEYLNVAYTKIAEMDLTKLPKLKTYWFNGAPSKSLNLSPCTQLENIILTDSKELSQLDVSGCKKLSLVFLDRTNLGQGGVKWPTELRSLTEIWIGGTSLDPVEILGRSSFLKKINAAYLKGAHPSTTIDLSPFKELDDAYLDGNPFITGIKTTGLEKLRMLSVSRCGVKEADLSTNPALTYFACYGNWSEDEKPIGTLTSCNIANGNSSGFTHLGLSDNPDLVCFQIDQSVEIKNGEAYVGGKRVTWRPKDEASPGADLHQDINWHVDAQMVPSYDCSSSTSSGTKARMKAHRSLNTLKKRGDSYYEAKMKQDRERAMVRVFPGIRK